MEERRGKLNVRYHNCEDGPNDVFTSVEDPKISVFQLPPPAPPIWQMNVEETCFDVKYCPWCGHALETLVEGSAN